MRKGWFKFEGQDGDRALADQVKGLDALWLACPGANVLDLGCAEGLISAECVKRGARQAVGIDVVGQHIVVARKLHPRPAHMFHELNLNDTPRLLDLLLALREGWDICLMLAILHKLREPLRLIDAVNEVHRCELVVVRLPAETPGFVLDARSGNVRHDVDASMKRHHYRLTSTDAGHFDEWVGYYERF